jgi:Ras-related protein Rab-7A
VGKTSLRHRYFRRSFQVSYKATIGADFVSKTVTVEDDEISLQVWDTAGQERYKSLGQITIACSSCMLELTRK